MEFADKWWKYLASFNWAISGR